ncbi:hypothetical protein EV380_1185 [Zhihengliuella halotolerans]|uniref:Uncharacterized protein n=1 Tax=Zhihengliuella halotolerans TaxID=370736 RepID=A0A4Q8ACY8_9MICC|nr:hypothetical protein EV380_1185 [Zhihengliuella halotolerans]
MMFCMPLSFPVPTTGVNEPSLPSHYLDIAFTLWTLHDDNGRCHGPRGHPPSSYTVVNQPQ